MNKELPTPIRDRLGGLAIVCIIIMIILIIADKTTDSKEDVSQTTNTLVVQASAVESSDTRGMELVYTDGYFRYYRDKTTNAMYIVHYKSATICEMTHPKTGKPLMYEQWLNYNE